VAASTQEIAAVMGAPPRGAAASDDVADVLLGVDGALDWAGEEAAREGVIGVSAVVRGGPWVHPATSSAAANCTAIRIRSG
jgi:hypothetical protein